MKKPKSNIKRIRAIEGSLSLSLVTFLLYNLLLIILKNIPSGESKIILWVAGTLFLSSLMGLFAGMSLNYIYYLLNNFFNDFFEDSEFRKIFLTFTMILFVIPFLISFGIILFNRPLENAKNIMAIIAYSVTTLVGIITIIIKIRKSRK